MDFWTLFGSKQAKNHNQMFCVVEMDKVDNKSSFMQLKSI